MRNNEFGVGLAFDEESTNDEVMFGLYTILPLPILYGV